MKKRGFTLVELLAVMAVLAVVVVIAFPVAISWIEDSKKNSFRNSVLSAYNSLDVELLKNGNASNEGDLEVLAKGMNVENGFTEGKFIINENNEITVSFIGNGEYCAYGTIDNFEVKKSCEELDASPPEIDIDKIHTYATSKKITVTLNPGFAKDDESGIKSYKVSLYLDGSKKAEKETTSNTITFEGLNHNTKYAIKVAAINGNLVPRETNFIDVKTVLIEKPTYSVSPSGWAQSKTVTITYPTGEDYTYEYSTDTGITWKKYSSPITVTQATTIIARANDGVNDGNNKDNDTWSSQTVTQIDTTKPTSASFTHAETSNSLTITASGTDAESGIISYAFSKDGGKTWTAAQSSPTHKFTGLTTGSYDIKVRVWNGTYVNGTTGNYLDSEPKTVKTVIIATPTCTTSPSGWSQSKTITCTYPSGYTNEYSLDGTTWKPYTGAVKLTANGTLIARVNDGVNYVKSSTQTITTIDTTKPTSASFTYTRTTKSITVTASGTDSQSGIIRYAFSKDNGSTWTSAQTSNSYTFNNLTTGTYNIKVRVWNGTYVNGTTGNYLDSAVQAIETIKFDKPTYSVSPSGWAQSKTVTITYPTASGLTKQYSTDGGTTWKTYSSAVKFTANGTIIARATDGTNTVTASSQTISQIDTSKPTAANFTYAVTTNSITVTASGTDSQSGIIRYAFSKDNGSTWTSAQTSNKYTFTGLTTGTYNIKVRVWNGTYVNGTTGNYLDSSAQSVSTTPITTPTYSVSPSGWSQSKTVTITYPTTSGLTKQYSTDGGTTWNTYSSAVKFTANGTIIARATDGTNTVTASSQTISQIDTSKPTAASFTYTRTTKSITVTASGTDSQSGIIRYAFSKDNGSTWTSAQTSNTYTFNNLTTGTYNIKVRVWNGTYVNGTTGNYLDSASQAIETIIFDKPTYSVSPSGWSQSKTVTITYPTASGLTKQYSTDGGTTWKTYSSAVKFTANGTIIARATDGTNTVTASSQTVTQIDTTAPTAASYTYTRTSKSFTVTASGTDAESGIARYSFTKDGGQTWTTPQTSNVYTFDNLKTGNYSIKVRVYNGTYANNGTTGNYKESGVNSLSTVTIAAPTCTVSPSGWSQSKTVTCTYPSGYTKQYSTDGGTTWNTYSAAVKFTAAGTLIARVTDGTNYVSSSSYSVTQIDTTAPTAASYSYSKTSNSITVTASGTDSQSGIVRYAYSKDGGSTWTTPQTSSRYTFSNLKTGTYSVKIRVYNGTYVNNGTTGNYKDSTAVSIATTTIAAPTCTTSPSGWSQSKTVTCTYPSGYTNQYSTDGGTTWNTYSSAVKFTAAGTIIARVTDGTNYVSSSSYSVTQIDTTAPTAASFSYSRTTKSITVTASGTDSQSGIIRYAFSKDGGTTWTSVQSSATYTFGSLTTGSYSIKVRVYNGTYVNGTTGNYKDSSASTISTLSIATPTYSVNTNDYVTSKTLTITYPTTSGLTKQYSTDGGTTWKTYSSPITVTQVTTVIARVTDGTNTVTASSYTVTKVGQKSWTFNYTGKGQSVVVPADGYYYIQAWGAQGGSSIMNGKEVASGGKGAYTSGKIYLQAGQTLTVNVGGMGGTPASGCTNTAGTAGYNGGGAGAVDSSDEKSTEASQCALELGGGGGGMSTVSLGSNKIMIAAGGGGAGRRRAGGSGGTLYGLSGNYVSSTTTTATDGTKTTTYAAEYMTYNEANWYGGRQIETSESNYTKYKYQGGAGGTGNDGGSGGSGGGFFGGRTSNNGGAGHGGSSWMVGYAGTANSPCYTGAVCAEMSFTPIYTTQQVGQIGSVGETVTVYPHFIDGKMIEGLKEGSGRIQIDYVSETKPTRNTNYDDVRYIKDCATGYIQVNTSAATKTTVHWNEIQAMVNGENVAAGATVSGITAAGATYSVTSGTKAVDGDITYSGYASASSASAGKCILVDLGATYDLDEIAVWHYYGNLNSRYYTGHTISVSSDNSSWKTISTDVQVENSNGQRYSAYSSKNYTMTYQFLGTGSTSSGRNQVFVAPYTGNYKIELWGAEGASHPSGHVDATSVNASKNGGKGGYVSGTISMTAGTPYYIYVGGMGNTTGSDNANGDPGGYNGGGTGGKRASKTTTATDGTTTTTYSGIRGGGGGGATDIRTNPAAWNNATGLGTRIAVAGGGGGAGGHGRLTYDGDTSYYQGGNGGAAGVAGSSGAIAPAGGSASTGGGAGGISAGGTAGTGGAGGNTSAGGTAYVGSGGGGGGGYYGGGGGAGGGRANSSSGTAGKAGAVGTLGTGGIGGQALYQNSYYGNAGGGGGGGSNYVGGLTSTTSKSGGVSMPTADGLSTKTGNGGHGYAKITFVG